MCFYEDIFLMKKVLCVASLLEMWYPVRQDRRCNMHHYFIINPAAGQGKAAKLVPAIREYMEGEGLPFTIYQTKGVGDAMAYVR